MLRQTIALALMGFLALSQPVSAQDDFFAEFHFNKLQFKFWPSGVENRQESDGKGSAITVHVDQVKIEGLGASELRHCIDHDMSFCSYNIPAGNEDGTVTADEVDSFERFVQVGIKREVPRVARFAEMLQKNVTVDGLQGKSALITRVDFQGAEGKIESEETVVAFVDAKVTYENDPKAKSHTIKVDDLPLKPELFIYESAIWVTSTDKWTFDAGATTPEAAKPRINSKGYFSNQDTFETLAADGMQIQVKEGGGKKSPGVESAVLIGAIAALALALRRRL